MSTDAQNIFEKRLLTHAQYIASVNSGVTIGILRKSALFEIIDIWKKLPQRDELISLIKNTAVTTLDTRINPALIKCFAPSEETQEFKQMERDISTSLWATIFSSPNPVYFALNEQFNLVKGIVRLHYLRLLQYVEDYGKLPDNIINPIGFAEEIRPLEEDKYLIFGYVWGEEDIRNKFREDRPADLLLEWYMGTIVDSLEDIHEIKLSYEHKAYLLNVTRMHTLLKRSALSEKAETASHALNKLFEFKKSHPEFIENIHASEWRAVVQWFLFLSNSHVRRITHRYISEIEEQRQELLNGKNIFKHLMNCLLGKNKQPIKLMPFNLKSTTALSARADRNRLTLSTTWATQNGETSPIDYCKIDFSREDTTSKQSFYFEKNSLPNEIESIIREMETSLQKFYQELQKFAHINKSHYERIFFDILRNDLQQMPFEEEDKRCERILKDARILVIADKATYCDYDGITNSLVPTAMVREWGLQKKSIIDEEIIKKTAKNILTNTLNNWANNRNKRQASVLYRAIDKLDIISRFESRDGLFKPEIKDRIIMNEVKSEWFANEDDAIAIPIMFHGRRQGVLYLSVCGAAQFLLQDRLRLLSYTRMFEAELFEARMLKTLGAINIDLGDALADKIKERELCDKLCAHIARLIGAADVSLWWRSKQQIAEFELIGGAGKKIQYLGEILIKNEDQLFLNILKSAEVVNISDLKNRGIIGQILYAAELKGCIQVPITKGKDIIGIMMIHDLEPQSEPIKAFQDELRFIANDIKEILLHYYEHTGQVNTIKLYLVHDLDASIRAIKSASERLKKYYSELTEPSKKDYLKRISDIERYVGLCHDNLDVLTKGKLERDIKLTAKDHLLAYIHHFSIKEELINPVDLYEITKSVIHANTSDMKDKQIRFKLQWNYSNNLMAWVYQDAVQVVLNNIIDNFKKYGRPYHTYTIEPLKTPSEWHIAIETEGFPLNDEAKQDPNIIFEEDTRCVPSNRGEFKGEGKGLYTAHQLARSWGGDIRLKYTDGEEWAKYIFLITFPLYLFKQDNPWKKR